MKKIIKVFLIMIIMIFLSACHKEYVFECPYGYELKEDMCQKEVYVNDALTEYYCNDDLVDETYECPAISTTNLVDVYKCPNGYNLNTDNTCTQTITKNATLNYRCPYGYHYESGTCKRTTFYIATKKYYCKPDGILYGDQCLYIFEMAASRNGSYYYCPSGLVEMGCRLSGRTCQCPTLIPAYIDYECLVGDIQSNNQCISVDYTTATLSYYSCPAGYLNEGTKCIKRNVVKATLKKGCPTKYKLENGLCNYYYYTKPQENYYCPDGTFLKNKNCFKYEKIEPTKIEK